MKAKLSQTMDKFLDTQQHQGERVDSGAFTINPEQARSKMAQFQLETPGGYLLKLVQAAVRCGAQQFDVTVKRDRLEASFVTTERDLLEPGLVADALLKLPTLEDSALRHLVLAINAACSQQAAEVVWQTPLGSLRLTPTTLELTEKKSALPRLLVRKERSLMQWFFGTVFVSEIAELGQRCRYAPLTLRLGKRPIDRPAWDRYDEFPIDELGLNEARYLFEDLQSGDDLWVGKPSLAGYEQIEGGYLWRERDDAMPFTNPAIPLLLRLGSEGVGAGADVLSLSLAVALPPRLQGPGRLMLVKDGVLLETVELDLGQPGAVVLTGAQGLGVDLSEFSVVQDERLETRAAAIAEGVRQAVDWVSEPVLRKSLARGGLKDDRLDAAAGRVFHWLQHHQLPQADTLEELVWQSFPGSLVQRAPGIPDKKLEGVRSVHGSNLPPEEPILAVYDDTIFGSAKRGFVITSERLCWKNTLESAGLVRLGNLRLGDVEATDGGVRLMGATIGIFGDEHHLSLRGSLIEFLRRASELSFSLSYEPDEQDIIEAGLEQLGLRGGMHYRPDVPRAKIVALAQYHPELADQQEPLILYDDTLTGSGGHGFAVYRDRVYFANMGEEPGRFEMGVSEVELVKEGVKLDEHLIYVTDAGTREAVAGFFRRLRR